MVLGWLFVMTVPRFLNLFLTPGKVYPLYGMHHRISHSITRMTNVKFFTQLFGNSAYSVYYLRRLGYHVFRIKQTGSNFGDEVAHENPYLCSVGRGTVIADGLSMMNAEFSSTSMRLARVSVGPRNFLGNNIAYPPDGRTGDNCLLATKVMVPLDGPIREGVGLLGSPSFEIPRSVERDSRFSAQQTDEDLRRGLARKKRYNLRTMGVFLFVRWLHLFLVTLLGMAAADLYEVLDHAVVGAFLALSVVLSAAYYILVERCFTAFRRLRPRLCSYYEPYFWWHERLWKVPADTYLNVFNGTPFKNLIWRLLGVRLGRGVFDDGCYLTERTLVTIGDHTMLNAGSKVQCHSQEDGAFKSDHTVIGADCTLGVGAFVHYGVTMGDGAVLDPDSFLMKGESVPPATRWGGNPATAIAAHLVAGPHDPLPALPAVRPSGRHHGDGGERPPGPAPRHLTIPAPRHVPMPGPGHAPAPTLGSTTGVGTSTTTGMGPAAGTATPLGARRPAGRHPRRNGQPAPPPRRPAPPPQWAPAPPPQMGTGTATEMDTGRTAEQSDPTDRPAPPSSGDARRSPIQRRHGRPQMTTPENRRRELSMHTQAKAGRAFWRDVLTTAGFTAIPQVDARAPGRGGRTRGSDPGGSDGRDPSAGGSPGDPHEYRAADRAPQGARRAVR